MRKGNWGVVGFGCFWGLEIFGRGGGVIVWFFGFFGVGEIRGVGSKRKMGIFLVIWGFMVFEDFFVLVLWVCVELFCRFSGFWKIGFFL